MVNLNQKDINDAIESTKRLVHDDYYYKYIFKKTERIASVVFYVLHNSPINSRTQSHVDDIQHAARSVHDAILQSLETYRYASDDTVRASAVALIALQSKLLVAHTVGIISADIFQLLKSEIDLVLRAMNKYLADGGGILLDGDTRRATTTEPTHTRSARSAQRSSSPASHQESDSGTNRRERIKTILEARGAASIKDISGIITDCSEKTIQRELNTMIAEGLIKRQGERRWSVYSIS